MIILDVTVLVYALKPELKHHRKAKDWLEIALVGGEPIGLWDSVLLSVFRVVTNQSVPGFVSTDTALTALANIRSATSVVYIQPALTYWTTFEQVVKENNIRGKLTSDAMLAALALDFGAKLATYDEDFAKFAGLQWFIPGE